MNFLTMYNHSPGKPSEISIMLSCSMAALEGTFEARSVQQRVQGPSTTVQDADVLSSLDAPSRLTKSGICVPAARHMEQPLSFLPSAFHLPDIKHTHKIQLSKGTN